MDKLTLGYLPLVDCAPLILAKHLGFYEAYDLDVTLQQVNSWARMRDLLANSELDAAHMLAPMVVASAMGLEPEARFTTALSLNLGGNAITLSKSIYEQLESHSGPNIASQLKAYVDARNGAGEPPMTLASVYPFSSHSYQLRHWLETGGIDPDRDVHLVVVPPPRMPEFLQSGQIFGYCVGEPWNLAAHRSGQGVTVMTAYELLGRAPEKVLAVQQDWADTQPDLHRRLIQSVYEACQKLEESETLKRASRLMRSHAGLNVEDDLIYMALTGKGLSLAGKADLSHRDFLRFHRDDANCPRQADAMWFARQMRKWGQVDRDVDLTEACARAYRTAFFHNAIASH